MPYGEIWKRILHILDRVHLACWVVEGICAIGSAIGSAWWARSSDLAWWQVALAAFVSFVLVGGLLFGFVYLASKALGGKRLFAFLYRAGISIEIGDGEPYHTYQHYRLYSRHHVVRVGVRNQFRNRPLTNCELVVERISGPLAGRCPVPVKCGFTINPGAEQFIDFVSLEEATQGPSLSEPHGIRAYFPISPLPSDKSSWLDDQPYQLTLLVTAAEAPPCSARLHLAVENGTLTLKRRAGRDRDGGQGSRVGD